jgi:hypothetical protein
MIVAQGGHAEYRSSFRPRGHARFFPGFFAHPPKNDCFV